MTMLQNNLNLDVLNGYDTTIFKYKTILNAKKLITCFRNLAALYKGRNTEKVFCIRCTKGIVTIEAVSVIYYVQILEKLSLTEAPEDFEVTFGYFDLSQNFDSSLVTVEVTNQYISFTTDTSKFTLNAVYSTVQNFLPLINTIEFKVIQTSDITESFKQLKVLRPITHDFPTHQSIHCKQGYAYIITPCMCAYIKGCKLNATIDIYTADLISNMCYEIEEVSLGYLSNYICIQSEETYILIPRVDYIPKGSDNPLKISAKPIAILEASILKKHLSRLKYKDKVTLSFSNDSVLIEFQNINLNYRAIIDIDTKETAYITTDALYLYNALNFFNYTDSISIKVGERLLVLETQNKRVYLSCIN